MHFRTGHALLRVPALVTLHALPLTLPSALETPTLSAFAAVEPVDATLRIPFRARRFKRGSKGV
eukprot:6191097-Pleurochrysis_carterae.AAC.1